MIKSMKTPRKERLKVKEERSQKLSSEALRKEENLQGLAELKLDNRARSFNIRLSPLQEFKLRVLSQQLLSRQPKNSPKGVTNAKGKNRSSAQLAREQLFLAAVTQPTLDSANERSFILPLGNKGYPPNIEYLDLGSLKGTSTLPLDPSSLPLPAPAIIREILIDLLEMLCPRPFVRLGDDELLRHVRANGKRLGRARAKVVGERRMVMRSRQEVNEYFGLDGIGAKPTKFATPGRPSAKTKEMMETGVTMMLRNIDGSGSGYAVEHKGTVNVPKKADYKDPMAETTEDWIEMVGWLLGELVAEMSHRGLRSANPKREPLHADLGDASLTTDTNGLQPVDQRTEESVEPGDAEGEEDFTDWAIPSANDEEISLEDAATILVNDLKH
jgi:hypothetical protein